MQPLPFKDNFSRQSDVYARFRPLYPDGLYAFLRSLTQGHDLVWDCGTGNGQAAVGLAGYYKRVMATDPSEQQIRNAMPHESVSYQVGRAEQAPLEDHCADLVTVATALHWFDLEVFYKEVRRVLKPGGVIAAWAYGNPYHGPEVDAVTGHLHDDILGSYWLAENRLVEKGYTTIPFPFEGIPAPEFRIERRLSRDGLLGLFHTWSAVQRYKDTNGSDPVELIKDQLAAVWQDREQEKLFTWKLAFKVGRV